MLTLTFRLSWPPVVETLHSQSPASSFIRCLTWNSQVICPGSMMALTSCGHRGAIHHCLRQHRPVGRPLILGEPATWVQGQCPGMVAGRGHGVDMGRVRHLEHGAVSLAQLHTVARGQRVAGGHAADDGLRAQVELQLRGQFDDLGEAVWCGEISVRAGRALPYVQEVLRPFPSHICSGAGAGLWAPSQIPPHAPGSATLSAQLVHESWSTHCPCRAAPCFLWGWGLFPPARWAAHPAA